MDLRSYFLFQEWGLLCLLHRSIFLSISNIYLLWPPHAKSWLIGKDSDAGRDWGQEEKGTTEEEMAGWHHWLEGHESEWTPGVGDGQGGLACCDSWGRKESDTTERLNWTESLSWSLVNFFALGFTFCKYNNPYFLKLKFVEYIYFQLFILILHMSLYLKWVSFKYHF